VEVCTETECNKKQTMASNSESASRDIQQENKDIERTLQDSTASPNMSKRKKELENRNEGNSNNGNYLLLW